MVIKLGLDDADFGRGVANSKKQVSYLAKEMSANMKIADMAGNQLGKLGTKYDGLTKIIGAQENQVKDLKKAYDDSFVDGKATEQTKRLAAQLQDANGKLANYKIQLQQTAGAMAEYKIRNEGFTGAVNKASDSLIIHGKRLESAGSAMTKGLTVPLVVGAAAVTTAAISWESAFAGVLKTNDEVVGKNGKVVYSFKDLEDGLRGLAKELPASHKEIAATAEAAGQLGIQTDNVVGFTKTMIDLGESTNMSAESAATSLARFANITQMSQKDFGKLGSVVVDLGNNFATTEQEIVDMGLRLAGAGKQIGMSEGEIMGFAAALSSVGVEAEAGGSAFSKVMVNMQLATEKGSVAFDELDAMARAAGYTLNDVNTAVQTGGKAQKGMASALGVSSKQLGKMYKEADKSAIALHQFSEVAGMTNMEFAELFKNDPSKAIMKFVEGLANAEKQGKSAIRVLDDMDITEVRLRDSLLRAANASGVFEGAVKQGNKAWKENTALTEEANKRYETTESKLKMLKNEVVDTAIDLGGPFVDALRDSLAVSKPLIKGLGDLAKAFSDADPKTQKMILGLIATAAAAGPLLSITGKLSGGIGGVGKSFVELSASMAKKKAITEVTKAFADGNVSAGDLLTTLGGGVGTVGKFGGAAATASGPAGLGAMMGVLGPLTPAILGVVGVGGALAVGYGAWKLWGEEAYNSAQRTKDWGIDVGKATGDALTEVKTYSGEAIGQFRLLEQGLTENTQSLAENFAKMGESIETNMIAKIRTLKELVDLMPEDVKKASEKITEEEVAHQEQYLEVVQKNNEKIAEIREDASKHNRELSYADAVRIRALSEESSVAYVQSLGKSETETKKILAAMTGDVTTASKEQAAEWLSNLGKQRNGSKTEYANMVKDLETGLVDAGYDLNSEYAKSQLELLKKSGESAATITEDQMAMILERYPELIDVVHLASGQMISETANASQYLIEDNEKLVESFGNFSQAVKEAADSNKKEIALTLDQSNAFGSFWNDLILDPKTGEVSTNAQEEVNKAAKSEKGWNQLMWISKDANVSSDVKMMIAEAAIANGKWEQMSFTEQQALLDSNVTQTMTQTLQAKGYWEKLTFDQKKAVIESNTPEMMAETVFNIGLWNELQPEVKELDAQNQKLISAVGQSEEKMADWKKIPDTVKQFQGENYDLLTKIYESNENFKRWQSIPNDEKIMLAENTDLLEKVATSKEVYGAWEKMPMTEKMMLGNNTDLSSKVFASTETMNAWIKLDPQIKALVAENQDLMAKVEDGTLSIDTFNKNEPGLKTLLGDATSVINQSIQAETALSNFHNNNPKNKILTGDSTNVQNASRTGVGSVNNFERATAKVKYLKAVDDASWNAGKATGAVQTFGRQGDKKITLTTVTKNITQWITEKFTKNATGTNFHPGGLAMVNDQRGAMYRELVQHPTGETYIPQGRNVMLDLPRGSKVYTAAQTKQMVPRYAEGVGIPKNSTLVKNLEAVNNRNIETTTVIQNDNRELVSLMRQMLNTIARLKPEINVNTQGNIEDLDLRNLNSDLGWLAQIEGGGLGG
ncbi:phage tail tape measure protein [Enterococcus alcedinis]